MSGALTHSGPGLLEASIVALVFGLGLSGRSRDMLFIACRPRLLLRALITIDVVAPLLTLSALSALRIPSSVVIGAALLAVSPAASLLPRKDSDIGSRPELMLACSVLGALLAIVSVPLWLSVISQFLIADATIAPLAVTRLVSVLFLLPLSLGIMLRRLAPALMARVSGPVIVIADALLLLVLGSFAVDALPAFRQLGAGFLLAMAALSACTVLIGHFAGGHEAPDRSVLGVLSGVRHPGLALLIARYNFEGDLVLAAVVASFLIGILVTLPYAYWRRQRRVVAPPSSPPQLAAEAPMLAPPAPR
ncbi:MAG TPA: hypothetical protein VH539_22560 [Gemmatimonadaceae bacterium]